MTSDPALSAASKRLGPPPPRALHCPTDSSICHSLLRALPSSPLRRQLYMQTHAPDDNREALSSLVRDRGALASLLGFDSFAHKSLARKVLSRPDDVTAMLQQIFASIQPALAEEYSELSRLKLQLQLAGGQVGGGAGGDKSGEGTVYPWDLPFLIQQQQQQQQEPQITESDVLDITSFLTLSKCLDGLSSLCHNLFGVSMTRVPLARGEAWCDGLIKYSFAQHDSSSSSSSSSSNNGDGNGLVGVVYLDLFGRADKFTGAAHFTLRCGAHNTDTYTSRHGHGVCAGLQQTPVIALVFSFPVRTADHCLTLTEVEQLYHEVSQSVCTVMYCYILLYTNN